MKSKDVIIFLARRLWKPTLQILLVIFTLQHIPIINLVSVVLILITWSVIFRLIQEAWDHKTPVLKEWINSILLTGGVTAIFYLLINFLGAFGILGLIGIITLLAAWRIYKSWNAFDYATTWGARKLTGKGGGDPGDFDWEKAYPDKSLNNTIKALEPDKIGKPGLPVKEDEQG